MPDVTDAVYFEHFVAWEILKNIDPSDADIVAGMMDSGDDGGVDALYLLVDGQVMDAPLDPSKIRQGPEMELIVIQSKFENSFSGNAVNKLHSIIPLLLNLDAKPVDHADVLHAGIREFRELFQKAYLGLAARHPKLRISFYICACADHNAIPTNAQGWTEPIRDACRASFSNAEVSVHLWGARQLYDAHAKLPPSSFTLSLVDVPISTRQGSYVALVPIKELLAMFQDESGSTRHYLFESNVRDFYVKSQVNEDIAQSVTSLEDLDFWWLNNGLTVLVTKISSAAKTLTIDNPQVVNGLQTSMALVHTASSIDIETKAEKSVLVKFVMINEDDAIDRIITATNSQNPMPPAARRALDPFQRQIEEWLKAEGLLYERRRNYYRSRNHSAAEIVSMEYLGQALMSVRMRRPNDARARPSSLLKEDSRYTTVFDPSIQLPEYLACARIAKLVDGCLSLLDLTANSRTNARFYVMMVLADLGLQSTATAGRSVASLTESDLTEERILMATNIVLNAFRSRVSVDEPEDRIAKGRYFVDELTSEVDVAIESLKLWAEAEGSRPT